MAEPDPNELSLSVAMPDGETRPGAREKGAYPFLRAPQGPGELGRFDGYRVIRLLGSGGMGFVFEAEELSLRRSVALKVLRPELAADPENRERFLREARAAAEIASDHVVTVLSVGEAAGVPFLTMPLLAGETLQTRIERLARVDLRTALVVARDTASGLAAAHARGLVHRDIKPANIWLETDGPAGPFKRARILDFGLARRPHEETSLTSTGFILGTPNYMSPEQAEGNEIDHRADLFSLGCVVYTTLTGALPFQGNSALAVMMALANKTPEPVTAKNPTVPRPVADLVNRLLEKKADDRVQTAVEVVRELDGAIAALTGGSPAPPTPVPAPPVNPVSLETVVPSKSATWPGGAPVAAGPRVERIRRRRAVLVGSGLALTAALSAFIGWRALWTAPQVLAPEPIVVGILHSESGPMAVSEMPLIDATVLAVEEVNAAGGVLGRPVRAVVVNGDSDPAQFQTGAERLIRTEKVAAIFGCMTSPSRKAVRPVVERDNGLLFFPVSYEGLEQSPRIVYVGSAPNQKFLPGVEYLVKTLGKKRLFVIGSDLVSPRSATEVVREHLKVVAPDARIVGSAFIPLGATDLAGALDALAAARPDAVVNVLNGSSNFSFYRELRKRGVRSADVPVLSISLSEHDLVGLDPKLVAGDYLAANYFQATDREESRAFLQKVQARFGDTRVVTDNMVSAYTGVHIWARAVAKAGTPDPAAVAEAVKGVEYDGPGGVIRIDPTNQHAWRRWRVGQVQPDGKVKVVDESKGSVRADPFPATRTRQEWERLLTELYVEWGGRWQAPTSDPEKK